jgi:hypothetical protein
MKKNFLILLNDLRVNVLHNSVYSFAKLSVKLLFLFVWIRIDTIEVLAFQIHSVISLIYSIGIHDGDYYKFEHFSEKLGL